MNTRFALIVLIILLLGFFSNDFSYTGQVVDQTLTPVGNVFTKERIHFMAWRNSGLSQGRFGEGEFRIDLPGEPQYCEIQGRWVTNNQMFKNLGRGSYHCHRASGTFTAYVDKLDQHSVNDPGLFRWAGGSEARYDPFPTATQDYVLHAWLCDHLYYTPKGPRYNIKLWVEHFGQHLDFRWSYYDDDTYPAVDVFFDLTCSLKEKKVSAPPPKVVLPPSAAQEPETEEPSPDLPFPLDLQQYQEPPPKQQRTAWQMITGWLKGTFF